MADTDVRLIIDSLKALTKTQGMTYKGLAKELSISEVSIKRVFSTYECSLSRLSELCNVLNTSLLEISKLAIKRSQNQNYYLTDEQDKYFSSAPFSFFVFREIYRGKSFKEVQEEFHLEQSEFIKTLNKLEKLKLLELHPNNRIKILISGQIRIDLMGSFFNKVMKKQNIEFLENVYREVKREDCCLQSSEIQLTKKSYMGMVSDINELGKKYREKSFIESKTTPSRDLNDVRWLFAFLPYKTDWSR
jgi:DNA-binding Xre family transcriptional regulator